MATNLVRNIFNKVLLNKRASNISQVRLDSYKAAIIKEISTPLVITDSKKPKKLEKNQVRVQVHYCSVNSNDCRAFKDSTLQVPFIPGYELSGEVLEIGSGVTPDYVTVGEKVAVLSRNKGGFAQQCVVDKIDVWRLPSKVNLKSAAVMVYGHSNAVYAFSRLANIKNDTTILIAAGSAGMGLAAVDVAANVYKVKPFGVCDNEERGELIRKRGAFATANFGSKNLLKDLNLKKGVDVVYDACGGEPHKNISACVRTEGIIFHSTPYSVSTFPKPPNNAWWMSLNIQSLRDTSPKLYRELVNDTLELADQGLIGAHVSAQYSFDKILDAIKYIEDKKCTGKVVIKIIDD